MHVCCIFAVYLRFIYTLSPKVYEIKTIVLTLPKILFQHIIIKKYIIKYFTQIKEQILSNSLYPKTVCRDVIYVLDVNENFNPFNLV